MNVDTYQLFIFTRFDPIKTHWLQRSFDRFRYTSTHSFLLGFHTMIPFFLFLGQPRLFKRKHNQFHNKPWSTPSDSSISFFFQIKSKHLIISNTFKTKREVFKYLLLKRIIWIVLSPKTPKQIKSFLSTWAFPFKTFQKGCANSILTNNNNT